MLWELTNPSDKIYFDAPDLRIAAVSCFVVGEGKYGAECQKTMDIVPIFILGGSEEWCKETFNQSVSEFVASTDMKKVSECLASFRYETERTSMNKIVDYAHGMSVLVKENSDG